MRAIRRMLLGGVAVAPLYVMAQHDLEQHHLEEVFVTAELNKREAETALPLDSLSGEALRKALGRSLGETLARQQGVRSASFGSGVGLPVIRGQSGRRVSVMQNGLASLDAAASSQDHANSVDPLVAERIEIIRGPATLLYGNGAIGGVVNVIDNRIPETLPDSLTGALELRHQNVSSEDASAFKLENAQGSFAWHLDGAYRDSGNTRIPGYAIREEALDDDHHDEGELHGENEHDDEVENTHGFIANSDSRSHSLAAGGSWIGDRGFIGLAVSHLENEYGLPPGAHLHADEPDEEDEHEDHAAHSDIRIDLRQTRYQLRTGLDTAGVFNRLNARLAYNDYEHTEFERDELHGEQHEAARFSNRGTEARLTGHYDRAVRDGLNWQGVLGSQISSSRFAVTGEEGFIPRTDTRSTGLFAMESLSTGRWIYELGVRLEYTETAPEQGCDRDDLSWSASAAAIWQALESVNLSVSGSRSQRAAGVEERYSNVDAATCALVDADLWKIHSPTGLVELGNPDLDEETANTLELALHKHLGNIHGELSVYFNRVNDYIYLAQAGTAGNNGLAYYRQKDAEFYGYEAEVSWPMQLTASHQLELTVFSDSVHAELRSGEYLPRIPPRQVGFAAALAEEHWSLSLRMADVARADRLAPNETPTDNYTLLDIGADYHFDWGNYNALLFAKGTNLLDETIRNHTSFAKNFAPEPGRAIELGLRLTF